MSESGKISDGYHTFDELYEHRIVLWIALCRQIGSDPRYRFGRDVWRSRLHSDGSSFDGWFVLGMGGAPGVQMTYHLPLSRWDECQFATEIARAHPFDGHTSADVLRRISEL